MLVYNELMMLLSLIQIPYPKILNEPHPKSVGG